MRPQPDHEAPPASAPVWRLDGDPAALARCAQAWHELAGTASRTGRELGAASAALLAEWAGPAAQAYRARRDQALHACATLSTVAASIGSTVDEAVAALRHTQDQLAAVWGRMRRSPLSSAAVAAAEDEAEQVRAYAVAILDGLAARLHEQRGQLPAHEAMPGEPGDAVWADTPELSGAAAVIVDGDRVIVNGTGVGDDIRIETEPATGEQMIWVNGVRRAFPPQARIVVRAGAGADTVRITSATGPTSATGTVTVLGGAGRDTVYGGDGDDTILGLGDEDTLLGGGGADLVDGGTGGDYVSGGTGDDVIDGGSGGDLLIGGQGRDLLAGGPGADALLGGAGADTLLGDGGTDRAMAEPGDMAEAEHVRRVAQAAPTDVVTVDSGSSPEFRARVESDLDALRSTDSGQRMLEALQRSHDRNGDTVVVVETSGAPAELGDPRAGAPVGATIRYNPSFAPPESGGPPMGPLAVLYHELAHAYDDFYDSAAPGQYRGADNAGVPNAEREAVGLPVDGPGQRWVARLHPFALTENGLRAELGLPPRTRY